MTTKQPAPKNRQRAIREYKYAAIRAGQYDPRLLAIETGDAA